MATAKQVQLLVRLLVLAGKIKPTEAAYYTAEAMAMPSDRVSQGIDKLNAEVGFDKRFNPATTTQRRFILDLELKILGKWETNHSVALTYAEADERIKYLKAIQAQRTKPVAAQTAQEPGSNVIDIFTRLAI